MLQLTIKCVICTNVYILQSVIACVDIICGILLAFVRTREVGVGSRNVVSRTFPHLSQSMLTPMGCGADFRGEVAKLVNKTHE